MMPHSHLRHLAHLLIASLLILAACSISPTALPPASPSQTSPAGSKEASTSTADSPSTIAVATHTSAPTSPAQLVCPPTQEGEVDHAAILELGPGPGIPATAAAGEKLVIVGSVFAEDCTPLAGAVLNVWQTDANGEYGPGHGSNDMRCCYLMGSLHTDAQGRYQLVTVKPAHYKGEQAPPPAHIHLEISHPQAGQLETEIVFAGDPYLPQNLHGYILVTLESVPGSSGTADYLSGAADIILN